MDNKIKEKFYPLTPEITKKLRDANLTAAEWRLWSYLIELDPFGDRYQDLPDTLTIMQKVDIKKTTFYTAIAKFQKLELFDFQDKGFAFRNLRGIPKIRKAVREIGSNSKNSENQSPEAASDKGSESSQTIQTYSDFIHTVSEGERESFKAFCKRKAAGYDKPVVLLSSWIEKHFDELYEMYQQVYEKDKCSAAPISPSKNGPELHPAIARGLQDGRIAKLDPDYNPPALWVKEGYWMSQQEWIERHGGDE